MHVLLYLEGTGIYNFNFFIQFGFGFFLLIDCAKSFRMYVKRFPLSYIVSKINLIKSANFQNFHFFYYYFFIQF